MGADWAKLPAASTIHFTRQLEALPAFGASQGTFHDVRPLKIAIFDNEDARLDAGEKQLVVKILKLLRVFDIGDDKMTA